MSTFACPVVRVTAVEHHPHADRLDLIYFRGFAVVSAKLDDGSPRYRVGDLVVYVPTDAVLPEYLLRQGFWNEELGHGLLDGPNHDRVKPRLLRKIMSEGIMFPLEDYGGTPHVVRRETSGSAVETTWRKAAENEDVAEFLGITKYIPPLPTGTDGLLTFVGNTSIIPHFDVENLKKYPDILLPDEEVTVTEKLHGTCFIFGWVKDLNHVDLIDGNTFAASKGSGSRGLVFKELDYTGIMKWVERVADRLSFGDWLRRKGWGRRPANQKNLYVAMKNQIIGDNRVLPYYATASAVVFGEIFGRGVQDLHYGTDRAHYRMFAACIDGQWISRDMLENLAVALGVETTPLLYRGPWSGYDPKLARGKTTFNDKHVREGGVITPVNPRRGEFGHIWLKDINEKYQTRKGGTEYT